jgi:hypothetical protein
VIIDVGQMAPSTIQDRLREVCQLRGLAPGALSVAAGLSRGYIDRILHSSDRSGIRADEAYRIAYEAKVSLAYLLYGTGSILGPDVPKEPPPPKPGQKRRLADHPRWVAVVLDAIEREPTMAWAMMGVGEMPADAAEELTVYWLLAAAEKFRRTCDDNDERERLWEVAHAFRKIHRPTRAAEPAKKRGSQPPSS